MFTFLEATYFPRDIPTVRRLYILTIEKLSCLSWKADI